MTLTKKSLGEIVAISLFIVVTTISIIGFQNFYGDYQSKNTAKIENRTSNIDKKLQIEEIIGDTLYITNTLGNNTSFNQIKVGNKTCNLNTTLSYGMNQVDIGRCLVNIENKAQEINLISNYSVNSINIYVKDLDKANSFSRIYYPGATASNFYTVIESKNNEELIIFGSHDIGSLMWNGYSWVPTSDPWLLKLDKYGNIILNKSNVIYGPIALEEDNGDIVIIKSDQIVIKINSSGDHLWNVTLPGSINIPSKSQIIKTTDGNYILLANNDFLSYKPRLIKINSSGNFLWGSNLPGDSSFGIGGVVETSSGGYAVFSANISSTPKSFNLILTDSTGNMLTYKSFTQSTNTYAGKIIKTVDEGYLLFGEYDWPGNSKGWIIKTNSSGDHQWNKTLGNKTSIVNIFNVNEYEYLVFYINDSIPNEEKLYLKKLNQNGEETLNQFILDGPSTLYVQDIIKNSDGGFTVVMVTIYPDIDYSAWIVKLNSRFNACYYEDNNYNC